MAMSVQEIKEWLNTLEDADEVGIDEGGLCLRVVSNTETYCEIGGIPEDSETE